MTEIMDGIGRFKVTVVGRSWTINLSKHELQELIDKE